MTHRANHGDSYKLQEEKANEAAIPEEAPPPKGTGLTKGHRGSLVREGDDQQGRQTLDIQWIFKMMSQDIC